MEKTRDRKGSTDEFMEVEPLLSPDGKQLYIMSTRAGGEGHGLLGQRLT